MFALGSMAVFTGACAQEESPPQNLADQGGDIKNGSPAKEYRWAGVVDYEAGGRNYACSGSLIGPKLFLTAGHCVDGASKFVVTLPYAGGKKATAARGETFYKSSGELVNFGTPDVGLIMLDTPLKLGKKAKYPIVSPDVVAADTTVRALGRINNGKLTSAMYISQAAKISKVFYSNTPYSFFYFEDIIESGDSGGPAILKGTQTIVGVASGGTDKAPIRNSFARLDNNRRYNGQTMYAWIQDRLQRTGAPSVVAALGEYSAALDPPGKSVPSDEEIVAANASYAQENPDESAEDPADAPTTE